MTLPTETCAPPGGTEPPVASAEITPFEPAPPFTLFPLSVEPNAPLPESAADLAERDRWFHDHLVYVPGIIASFLAHEVWLPASRVLDFGCGEGLMAAGMKRYAREVHGIDIQPDFRHLESRLDATLGQGHGLLPDSLTVIPPGSRLPFDNHSFDAVFSWSVFEHVLDLPAALSSIRRVLRPGGVLFHQISPLYYSAHGSHLGHVLPDPWLHLTATDAELVARLGAQAELSVPAEAQSEAFREKSVAEFRDCLMGCFRTLNRITADQLTQATVEAGFTLLHRQLIPGAHVDPPAELLERYNRDDLITEQVVLVARA